MKPVQTVLIGAATVAVLTAGAAASMTRQMPTTPRPVVDGVAFLQSVVETNVMQTAELATPELLAYRPSADVRTFGEILGHIADSQKAFCDGALGRNVVPNQAVEHGVTTKDGLIQALRSSFAGCRAIVEKLSDAEASTLVAFGKGQVAVATLLAFGWSHSNEHYGNLVTYMRMNGIVPPSSRGEM